MSLLPGKQYDYFKLKEDWCGKPSGTVFKVSLDKGSVDWIDSVSLSQVNLPLTSPLLEKLPDLDITEFIYKDSVIYRRHRQTNVYKSDSKESLTIDEIIDNSDFKIFSVRNSLGIEFNLGERTPSGKIEAFEIQKHHEIHALFNEGKNSADVNALEKIYYSSDKVLIDWQEIKEQCSMSMEEWRRYLEHNHGSMLPNMGLEGWNISDVFQKFHYSFLRGPLQQFFGKFDFDFEVTKNEKGTHYGYIITMPNGTKKRNSGFGDFEEPLFPTERHAHASAVRSLFQHLHNTIKSKSREKLETKE